MLHALEVPKGTLFTGVTINGPRIFAYPAGSTPLCKLDMSTLCFVPTVGYPIPRSTDVDCGWISQGPDHGGQKDVEQLDLDGVILPRSYFLDVRPFPPGKTVVSGACTEWFSISAKQFGTAFTSWFSHMCYPTGVTLVSRDYVGFVEGTPSGAHPIRVVAVCGWADPFTLVNALFYRYMDNTATGMPSISLTKFSSDYSKYALVSQNLPIASIPTNAGVDTYWSEITRLAPIWCGTVTPTSSFVSGAMSTNLDLRNVDLHPFKLLDRSEVFFGELNPDWGDLAYDCYSQIQLWNSNGLAYGRDLIMITRAARDLVQTAKSLLGSKNIVKASKSLADLFLSFRYGWFLSAKDTMSLLKTDYDRAYPSGRCKRSSAYTYFRNGNTITARCSVYCRPYSDSVTELEGFLRMMDLDLTLENIWDLIPFSFVVDWVADVGGLLDRMDKWGQLDKYRIFLTGKSLKVSTRLAAHRIVQLASMVGELQGRYYKRVYSPDVIPPSLASSRTPNQKNSHWLEGSALAIQRLG